MRLDSTCAKCRDHRVAQLLERMYEDLAWLRAQGSLLLRLKLRAQAKEAEAIVSQSSRARVDRSSTIAPRGHARGDTVERQMLGARVGQRREQHFPVLLGDDASIEQHHGAVVRL